MHALLLAATLPFIQAWGDTELISRDDDWAGVAGVAGHRGDGLTSAAGTDPRAVVVDGSGTPVDVNANETDPRAVGLAAGVTEFELPDPVVALQGSATAAAPHLLLSLDTRGGSGVTVRYRLRDVDPSSIANAVQSVALQYRVGASGSFAAVRGGFVADATTGPGLAGLETPVSAVLPAAAGNRPLVQVRILTTNAIGQDEWVGVDDIEVEASEAAAYAAGSAAADAAALATAPFDPATGNAPSPHRPQPVAKQVQARKKGPCAEPHRQGRHFPEIPPVATGQGGVPGDTRPDAESAPGTHSASPARGRPLPRSRPPRPQPAPLHRKAARSRVYPPAPTG